MADISSGSEYIAFDRSLFWPAEWSPHSASILLYPHNSSTYCLERVVPEFLAVIQAIQNEGEESVLLFYKDDSHVEQVKKKLQLLRDDHDGKAARIIVLTCPSNDSWARDTAPTFVVNTKDSETTTLVGLDWKFNSYGGEMEGCYWPCTADQEAAGIMCREIMVANQFSNMVSARIQHKTVPLVLEGGSIHTDGQGTVLATKECLLHSNRNPTLTQAEIETFVLEATGCSKMIWLEHGLAFDSDTNGHVDNWASFVAPGIVVLAWTDDVLGHVENYKRCRDSLAVMEKATDAVGRSLTVIKLHLPKPMFYTQQEIESLQQLDDSEGRLVAPKRQKGERMAASYVNFYIANKAVIVPQFGDSEFDTKAVETLQELFSKHDNDRKVVGVFSREILIGGGNIHCITQQIPKTTV